MRLSGEEGASVYNNLRPRSAAMRTAMLHDEIAEANAVGERMTIPGSLLGVIFMALLVAQPCCGCSATPDTQDPTKGNRSRKGKSPMNRLLTLLLTVHLGVDARLRARDERGSVTTEHVLWAVAVIAIVGIVVAAIKA